MYIYMKKSKLFNLLIPMLVVLLILPFNLSARSNRKGAKMMVYKTDGEVIKGRLIEVDYKDGWFVVKHRYELTGTRIRIGDVEEIKIKSVKMGKYIGGGLLIGVGFGIVYGLAEGKHSCVWENQAVKGNAIVWGLLGTLLGAVQGMAKQISGKKIIVLGKSRSEQMRILKKLSKKAMIRH